jgi:hypothetical protein
MLVNVIQESRPAPCNQAWAVSSSGRRGGGPGAEKDKARCSSTDPEATIVKMADGGFRPASNIEYGADTGNLSF